MLPDLTRERGRSRDTPAVVAIFAMVLLGVCGFFSVVGVMLIWVLFVVGSSLFAYVSLWSVLATLAVPLPVGMAAFDLIKLNTRAHRTTMVACGVLLAWVVVIAPDGWEGESAWIFFEWEWIPITLAAIAVVAAALPKTIYRDYFANSGAHKRIEDEF